MGCWSIAGLPPALSSPVIIHTPGWGEALWEQSVLPENTTQCPRTGLEPGPLDPETSALTMRLPRLPPRVLRKGTKSPFQAEVLLRLKAEFGSHTCTASQKEEGSIVTNPLSRKS